MVPKKLNPYVQFSSSDFDNHQSLNTMEQGLKLVSALRLDTEFLPGGVKHRRHIQKRKQSQSSQPSKKRKRPSKYLSQIEQDSPLQVEEESPVQIDGESAIQIAESSVPDETAQIEIEEIWDIEPSSIIGQGAFGIVRFERRRPQMANHTQTTHNQVRAVKEIRKLSTLDHMKELQAIAKFSQAQVRWNLSLPL
jgi:hypothetical protein